MTSFETGVWQAAFGASIQYTGSSIAAAVAAEQAVNALRFGATADWMPVAEGNYELPQAEAECVDPANPMVEGNGP